MLLLVFLCFVCLFSLYLLNYSFRLYCSFVRACITSYLDDSPLHLHYHCHLNEKNIVNLYAIEIKQGLHSTEKLGWGWGWGRDFEKSQGNQITIFVVCRNTYFRLRPGIFKILKQLCPFLFIPHLLLHDTLDRALSRS